MLYAIREVHPCSRADVAVLFGKYLPRAGIMSDLLAAIGTQDDPAWGGGRVFGLRLGRPSGLRKRCAVAVCDLLLLLRARSRYDAIQVRDRPFGALVGLLAAKWAGIPFFYWMSFSFPEAWLDMARSGAVAGRARRASWYLKGLASYFVLYRCVLPHSAHVFVQSDRMRDDVQRHGIARACMTPVPMGADLEGSDDARLPETAVAFPGRKVLVYLGALERTRHPEVMIDAMALIRDKWPHALLVLVGDSQTPGDREWLVQRCHERGIEKNVHFTGWVSQRKAQAFLRAAQIGLSPFPVTPGFDTASPTKIVEYAAQGLPVVANDHPDQARLLKASGGGLCVPMTAAGFAEGIDRLLGDPVAAKAMGAAGKQYVSAVRSYHAISQALAETYFRLLEKPAEQDRAPLEAHAQGESVTGAERVKES